MCAGRGILLVGLLGFIGFFGLLLTGCENTRPAIPPPSELLGPYTATGTIMGTGASLYRRGTHVLLMDGSPRFFLESRTIDLRQYEGSTASVQGELFPNTHPAFLPVLQVAAVTLQEGKEVPHLQRYDVPALGLSLEAPAAWKSTLSHDTLTFQRGREEGNSASPFLTIGRSERDAFPEGLPLRVGGRNAVRSVDEAKGEHRVYVDPSTGSPLRQGSEGQARQGDLLLFTFAPQDPESALLRDAFYTLLRSVRFLEEEEGEGEESSEDPFIPCGGPAHVLCPSGMYCEVRELDTGIGVCRKLAS